MKRRVNTGFTLLEVLIALGIFALAGTAIVKSVTDHINNVTMIEQITFATWVANNRLTQLNLEETFPPKNNQKGDMELAGQKWFWQQIVTETEDKDMRQLEIQVRLNQDSEFAITSVTTFMAKVK